MNSSLIGAYVPQCDEETGGFSVVQCHGSTAYCWCVAEESGRPVSDVTRFRQPQCSESKEQCNNTDGSYKWTPNAEDNSGWVNSSVPIQYRG